MPTPAELNCAAVLYAAAAATFGIVVKTNNAAKARAALYRFRNTLNDPELQPLTIRVSPDNSETELWLLNGEKALTISVDDL